jgi:hypothetical protein
LQGTPGTSVRIIGSFALTEGSEDSQLNSNFNSATSGDGVIDTNTGDLWVYDGADWNNVGNIRGPQGIQGTQGLQGNQGVIGAQGFQGTQGSQGLQGLQGNQGTIGAQGFQGTQGSQGLQGTQGSQGLQGNQGTIGAQGFQGTQGSQGLQGTQGSQGLQGLQGNQGTIGAQGFQGTQGSQGLQGSQGTQGFQGTQGSQGFQGTQGSQGLQGSQGTQGFQGTQGTQGFQGIQGSSAENYWVSTENVGLHTLSAVGIGTTNPLAEVDSGNQTILAAGIVTAYKFYGDGSELQNVGSTLTVSTKAGSSGINSTDAVSDVTAIRFDKTTGFSVSDLGSGEVFVELGSTFKTWTVDGQTSLVAVGEDEIEFIAGPGIAITTKATDPKAITFSVDESELTLDTPTDGSLVSPGALNTFDNQTKIIDSIDDLNELALNMMKNTAVSNLDFTSSTTAGGSPLSISAVATFTGSADKFDVDWGDGTTTSDYTNTSIPHTYTQANGGQFTITMTAKNSSGIGAGSSFTTTKQNYITVYTPDPVVSFALYRGASGGSAISGNNLYVIEGDATYGTLYMDNNTTNTSGATVDYTMNWGDGSTNDSIANDNANGGVSGSRLSHSWSEGTSSGTSRDTLRLTLNNHNTADPNVIPTNSIVNLKVYDDAPTAPDGLSTKTLTMIVDSQSGPSIGNFPLLAYNFTDNVSGGTALSASSSVNRAIPGQTVNAGPFSGYAYDASAGILTAYVDGSADGDITLTNTLLTDPVTDASLQIIAESDYQLLDSSGEAESFAQSIYHPDLYQGFLARVRKETNSMATGAHSMQLVHSTTGSTNTISFVKDNMTNNPVVNISSATIQEDTSGTYRYISGIPYYNSGNPSLTLSNVTVTNLVGQCYTDQNDIVEVDPGTTSEGTGGIIDETGFAYSEINNSGSPMLNGTTPIANTGISSAYTIGDLIVPITTVNVRSVGKVKVRAKNVNGNSNYTSSINTNIQVHKSNQSGISEIGIDVSNSLGNGDFTDDGIRIFDLSSETSNTPAFSSTTNYYSTTTNHYSESSDPGISTTRESVVRMGVIKHDTNNYSSGYLPVGPDLSSTSSPDRTQVQYFTFAFRRRNVQNFDIQIASGSTGIKGLWIAAPGTFIDSTSGLNGWLRADTAYGGSGTPGSGTGGNNSDGCAYNDGDRILNDTQLFTTNSHTMTLGTQNSTSAQDNVILVRIALASGQTVTSLSIEEPSIE